MLRDELHSAGHVRVLGAIVLWCRMFQPATAMIPSSKVNQSTPRGFLWLLQPGRHQLPAVAESSGGGGGKLTILCHTAHHRTTFLHPRVSSLSSSLYQEKILLNHLSTAFLLLISVAYSDVFAITHLGGAGM